MIFLAGWNPRDIYQKETGLNLLFWLVFLELFHLCFQLSVLDNVNVKTEYLFIIDDPTGNIIRITDVLKNFKDKLEIKPIGFIYAKNKVYVSLSNGRLVTVNSSMGIQENITKISNSKISIPYILVFSPK